MTVIWTANDVVEHFKQSQLKDEGIGSDKEIFDRIINWMNSEDPNWINVIGLTSPRRPGAILFLVLTEHMYFPPKTEKNHEFLLLNIGWERMMFYIVAIPFEYKYKIDFLAEKCGVKLCNGSPAALTSSGFNIFPVKGANSFNLENVKGHPIHGRSISGDVFQSEDDIINRIIGADLDLSTFAS